MTSTHAAVLSGLRKRTRPTRSVPRPPRPANTNRKAQRFDDELASTSLRDDGHFGGAVGYRNPPVAGQFKKGQSGNPKGRPKGTKNAKPLEDVLRAEWDASIMLVENGARIERAAPEVAILKLRQMALSGDRAALKHYLELMLNHARPEIAEQVEDVLSVEDEDILKALLEARRRDHGAADHA